MFRVTHSQYSFLLASIEENEDFRLMTACRYLTQDMKSTEASRAPSLYAAKFYVLRAFLVVFLAVKHGNPSNYDFVSFQNFFNIGIPTSRSLIQTCEKKNINRMKSLHHDRCGLHC